jgi:hypothetical protein
LTFSVVLVATLAVPLWAQTAGTAHLSGRVLDTAGNVLPGTTVTVTGNGTIASAVTDVDGRFVVDAFVDSSRTYTVTASLPGFETTTRRQVRAVPGQTVPIGDIALRLGCADVDLVIERGIVAEARDADLVAHVRVESVAAAQEWRGAYGCVIARDVMAEVRGDTAAGKVRHVRFLTTTRSPLAPGDELVAAFEWDPVARRYTSWTRGAAVSNGVVALDDMSVGAGFDQEMAVDALLRRLERDRR